MTKILSQRFSVSLLTLLTAGLLGMSASTAAFADSRINHCSRWNSKPAIAWLATEQGRDSARAAAATLLKAASHGLDPLDYRAEKLAARFEELTGVSNRSTESQIRQFNKDFTRSVVCYLQNVSSGRLNPHRLYKGAFLPRQKFGQYRALTNAFQRGQVDELLRTAAPQSDEYVSLKTGLQRLHSLARIEADLSELHLSGKVAVKPGDRDPIVVQLRERLIFLGDLIPLGMGFEGIIPSIDKQVADDRFTRAVKRFQKRHGLKTDGIVGARVLTAMKVPMIRRIAQTELALERIRWYPRASGKRIVRVNIPAYTMTAAASDFAGSTELLSSKVIVGQPGRRHTPLFAGPITRIEFSPTWYLPQSIAKRSVLPILRRNPGYMKENGFVFRLPNGKTSQIVSASNIERVAANKLRMMQLPGPNNALGKVKFVLPNHRAIFLHDTSQPDLFSKDTRALSSGCVRVQKPIELAKLLLADHPKWDAQAIARAASASSTAVARATKSTMVMLQYLTAVNGRNGQMQFMPDIYGMDNTAYKAVKRWKSPVTPVVPNMELLSRLQAPIKTS